MTSRNKSGIAQQRNDFGQDNFDAPSQLGFQRQAVAKFTATKSWFKTLRHPRDEPSKTKDIHTNDLFSESSTCTCTFWVVAFCSRPDAYVGSRASDALSVSIGLQPLKTYWLHMRLFLLAPGPNPVVTISTRVWPGSRLAHSVSYSQIRARCLGKAQAEVQLNSLNCQDPELTWEEPTDALTDAASGEGDAGAPLDAKQLRKIAETGNHIFLFVLYCNSYFTYLCCSVCVCVCSSIDADTGNQNFLFTDWMGGWVLGNTNVLRTENNTLYVRTAS